jgi:hypothetical protein
MGAVGQMLTKAFEPLSMTELDVRSWGNPSIAVTRASTARDISTAVSLIVPEYHRRNYLESTDDKIRSEQFASLQTYDATYIAWEGSQPVTTLSCSKSNRLPMDDIFGHELDSLRCKGLRICEFGKLAGQNSLEIVLRLMAEVFVSEAQDVDVITITVNPRHRRTYAKKLGFSYLDRSPRSYPLLHTSPLAIGMFAFLSQIRTTSWSINTLAALSCR